MSIIGMSANTQTLLVLAWAAGKPELREELIGAKRANEDSTVLLRQRVEKALPVFNQESAYGFLFQRLVQQCLNQVEFQLVDWAMRGFSAVYMHDPALASDQEASSSNDETAWVWDALHQAVTQGEHQVYAAAGRGGELLRQHVQSQVVATTVAGPFLVREFVMMGLERVDWDALAVMLRSAFL